MCTLGVLCCVCDVLGHLAAVHRFARSACCVVCAVPWAIRLLLTGVHAQRVVLRVPCPRPPGSCSSVCTLDVFAVTAVSWVTWLLFSGVYALCLVRCVRCPGPLGSCTWLGTLHMLFCECGVLGNVASVHWCARSVCCAVCAVSWATWLLFTGVHARCVVLHVRGPRPLGSRSPVCTLSVLCCVCGVLGNLAPVHGCVRSVCCAVCRVSRAIWRLFTGVHARCAVLRVRCPWPLGSCSPVCRPGVL